VKLERKKADFTVNSKLASLFRSTWKRKLAADRGGHIEKYSFLIYGLR